MPMCVLKLSEILGQSSITEPSLLMENIKGGKVERMSLLGYSRKIVS